MHEEQAAQVGELVQDKVGALGRLASFAPNQADADVRPPDHADVVRPVADRLCVHVSPPGGSVIEAAARPWRHPGAAS